MYVAAYLYKRTYKEMTFPHPLIGP